VDFFACRLVRARWLNSGGDDDPAELGGHVGGGWLFLAAVPAGASAAVLHVGGVMPGGGVPAGGDRLASELERHGAFDRAGDPVASLPGAEDLLAIFDGDFDAPPGRMALDDLGGGGGGVGGDQGQVVSGPGLVADEHDGDGPGAEDRVPQAGERGGADGCGLPVAGDGDLPERGGGGERGQGGKPVSLFPGAARNGGKRLAGPALERFLPWNASPEDLRTWAQPPPDG
jgi:hypothetical protein